MPTPINPHDHIAIQNTLSRYCEALDTKDWLLLSKVFVTDVDADYPFNRSLKGVENVAKAIQGRLTTQTIIFKEDGSAQATTYFIGCHFGQGTHEGKVLQAYGRYVDELVVQEAAAGDYEGVQGASGVWRIRKRTVGFTARIGDENIMKEF
ncbi:hypothetical protein N0V90_003294 [Kalmusia sp. IMI 367209]|nr:hypothetical protein N0V90_003294 [Kalmusia sp. IMI 367209]